MGTWSTSIDGNDSFMDVYDTFFDLYNQGHNVPEITQHLVNEFKQDLEEFNDLEFYHEFWFAIAKCQWECKELDKKVFEIVEGIIKNDENVSEWHNLGASEIDIKKRKKKFFEFLEKLKTEKRKPKKRVKIKLYNSIFKKGDCLTYKMSNGNYGGAFVLTDSVNDRYAHNFIALTDINKIEKPNLSDIKNSEVLIVEDSIHKQKYQMIGRFEQSSYKKKNFEIELIGNLSLKRPYNPENSHFGFPWERLREPFIQSFQKEIRDSELRFKIEEWL